MICSNTLRLTAVAIDDMNLGDGEAVKLDPTLPRTSSARQGSNPNNTATYQRNAATRVLYTPRAASNLKNLQDYISAHNPAAAFQMLKTIRSRISNLVEYPRSGRPGRIKGTRELIISHTPYIVSYRINKSGNEVLAVLHGARRWPDEF